MRRDEFITLIGGVVVWPLATAAQLTQQPTQAATNPSQTKMVRVKPLTRRPQSCGFD
jgi:hypothetical protein